MSKVWLCWVNDWEDHYVAKVFNSEEKASEWKKSIDSLTSDFPDDFAKWDSNFKKSIEMEDEFKKLGVSHSDWNCSFELEEMMVE